METRTQRSRLRAIQTIHASQDKMTPPLLRLRRVGKSPNLGVEAAIAVVVGEVA